MDCPTFLLIPKFLEIFHEALEQLSLNIPHEPRKLITKIVQHSIFPRLKILKLEEQLDTTQVAYTKLWSRDLKERRGASARGVGRRIPWNKDVPDIGSKKSTVSQFLPSVIVLIICSTSRNHP